MEQQEWVSNCCGAKIIDEGVCSDCLEHCDGVPLEEDEDTPDQYN